MPRRSSLRPDELTSALAGATVVRVDHLVALGLTRSTIAHRCRPGGPWRRLAPGIVKLDNGPVTRADRRRAALLLAGVGAVSPASTRSSCTGCGECLRRPGRCTS